MDVRSRRDLLLGGGALAAGSLLSKLGCKPPGRAAQPPDAAAARWPLSVDLHNHVYPAGTEPKPGAPGGGPRDGGGPRGRDGGPAPGGGGHPPEATPGPALPLGAELGRTGFTAVCASFVLDFARNVEPGDARNNYLRWLSAIDAELARGQVKRAFVAADLEAAHERGHPVIVQSVEGAHFVEGRLERVDEVYGRGLRHLQLLHERDDLVAPLGDTNTGVAHLGGLTAVGADVVRACNRLGIVVDLAHGSSETVRAALRVSTHPLIVSHTNLDTWTGSNARMAEMMRPRLISKDLAREVADAGGVVGVWTHLTSSLQEFVQSIKLMVDAIGAEHVGIGTDTDLLSSQPGKSTDSAWPGLTDGFAHGVIIEMRRQGFTSDEVQQVAGGNYARVFGIATRTSE